MIVSKKNLSVVGIVRKDNDVPVLNNVLLCRDGTTVAAAKNLVVAVSPVQEKMKEGLPVKETCLSEDIILSEETVKDLLRNMPKDSLFKGRLEHADISEDCTIVVHDGKREKHIKGKCYTGKYIPWRSYMKGQKDFKFVVNGSRLKMLLEIMEQVVGDVPFFIEGSEAGIKVRGVDPLTRQRIVGVMSCYKDVKGKWAEEDEWEKSLTGVSKKEKI